MVALRIVDSYLVSEAEFFSKGIDRQLSARLAGAAVTPIDLHSGATLDLAASAPPLYTMPDGATPLPEIGYGQPLTIDIRHVYSGRVGVHSILDGTGDIAVLSGVKNWGVFKASARALNFVAIGKGKKTTVTEPGATTDGTPIVAYQKAVTSSQVTATIEMAASGKQDGLSTQLGSAFTAAAGIPLLLPYAGYFLAAGQLLPILGKLADAIGSGATSWSQQVEINFGLPGTVPSVAEFRLVTGNPAEHAPYQFKAGIGLVDSTGAVYDGDEPYAVVAVYGDDGRADLTSFAPTVATADLLARFYSAANGGSALLGDLSDILKLASDMKFREQAIDLKAQIAAAGGDATKTAQLQAQLTAVLANIKDPTLKP